MSKEAVAFDECGTMVTILMSKGDTLDTLNEKYPEYTFRYVQDVPDYSDHDEWLKEQMSKTAYYD